MVLLESQMVPLGTPAPDFSLKGIDDRPHTLHKYADKDILVIIFMCNHCPYVQAVWPRLNALQKKYASKNVQLIGINPNAANPNYSDDNFEEMKKAPQEFGMNFPYLIDEMQEVARAYRAVCTPDIFVFDRSLKLVYRGRVDDNWKDENAATRHELSGALDILLSGGQLTEGQRPSMGCSIKWL